MFPWNFSPFGNDFKKMMEKMNPYQTEDFVKNMMEQYMPTFGKNEQGNSTHQGNPFSQQGHAQEQQTKDNSESSSVEAKVFETFDHVYVRVMINDENWLKELRIFHTSNQVILENIPEEGERQIITLPCIVKKKGAVAQYKDHILELKIPNNIDYQFTEVDFSERK